MQGIGWSTGAKRPVIMLCTVLTALATATAWSADAGPLRVLSHESLRPVIDPVAPGQSKPAAGSYRNFKFDAFGRRFSLALEKNTRFGALAGSNEDQSALTLYQGTVEGIPESWVRLTARAQEIRGVIWDGRELYVVDSAAALDDAGTTSGTIIFKLADTQVDAGTSFCGATASSGKHAYGSLLDELKSSPVIMQAAGASRRLELSVLGDTLFRNRYPSEQQARDEILTRLNIVDGIFSSQLGVEVQPSAINIDDAITDQLSTTRDGNALVNEVASLRNATPSLRARGLTHLYTGRDLDGTTVGIAFTDSLCSSKWGAGLTQVSNFAGIDALVTAHEIGHNFGAPHDGDAGKACASTPVNQFIMSPSVNQNATTFSQCSRDVILPRIQNASCLLPMAPPDLSVDTDLGTRTEAVSDAFSWQLSINNVGGSAAQHSRVVLFVPPVMNIDEAWVPGGTCTSGAGVIACEMGAIAAAGSRVVHLTLRSEVVGSNSISARVQALGDAQSVNDTGDGTLVIASQIDLGVSLEAPTSVGMNATASGSFVAQNTAAIDATDVTVELTLSSEIAASAVQMANASCELDSSIVRCTLPVLAAGQSASGTVTFSGSAAGTGTAQARITGASIDPVSANDTAQRSITVMQTAQARQSPAAGGGGGGGSTGSLLLAALAGLLGIRLGRSRC